MQTVKKSSQEDLEGSLAVEHVYCMREVGSFKDALAHELAGLTFGALAQSNA